MVLSVLDGVDPTYVRGLLEGFEHAARNGAAVPWAAALSFVAAAAAKEDTGEDPVVHMLVRGRKLAVDAFAGSGRHRHCLRRSGGLDGERNLAGAWQRPLPLFAESPDRCQRPRPAGA